MIFRHSSEHGTTTTSVRSIEVRLNDPYILCGLLLLLDGMQEPARAPFLDVGMKQAVDVGPMRPTARMVSLHADAMLALQATRGWIESASIATRTAPAPPGPGFPREPPSKNSRYVDVGAAGGRGDSGGPESPTVRARDVLTSGTSRVRAIPYDLRLRGIAPGETCGKYLTVVSPRASLQSLRAASAILRRVGLPGWSSRTRKVI
jgi:hypothetical protein